MEEEIVNIIIKIFYTSTINELYQSKATKYDFPIVFDMNKLPFNVLYDFNKEYFNTYEHILLKNSFIFANIINDEKFLNYFIDNIYDLDSAYQNELLFKIRICEYAIKHIFNKYYSKEDDSKIIKDNKDILDIIDKKCIKIQSIFSLYRNIFIKFVEKFDIEDHEIIMDRILYTDEYDNDFISENKNFISKGNIKDFKNTISRLIFTDNFIFIENCLADEDGTEFELIADRKIIKESNIRYKYIENDDKDNDLDDEGIDDDENIIDEENFINSTQLRILNYIRSCIKNNSYIFPKDEELRWNMYSIFSSYYSYDKDRLTDYEVILKDNVKKLELKKLNPLYAMDLIDGGNN